MCAINDKAWQERLYGLCNRFSHLGIGGCDNASLPRVEQGGLYLFLRRLTEDLSDG